jgi:alpha-beta hydrolase superfamily lysophospholipase
MTTESIWLEAKDGAKLFTKVFRPETQPVGCIAMVHGYGEHTGRYLRVAEFFCDRGYVFAIHDQRGHGKSPGKRGVAPSYGTLTTDIDLVLAWLESKHPGLPVCLYGHSMGGNLALSRVVADDLPASVRCVVAGSPWLRLAKDPPALTVLMAKIISKIIPDFTAKSTLAIDDLTRSETVRAETKADPDYLDDIGARIFQEITANGERILAEADKVRVPLYVMVGTHDLVVSQAAVEAFIKDCGIRCESRIWPEFYHELHNEPGGEQVLMEVAAFIDRAMKVQRG